MSSIPKLRFRWKRRAIALVAGLAFTAAVSFSFAIKVADAAFDEAMLGFGTALVEHPGSQNDSARDLIVNGARVRLTSRTVDVPHDEVLDSFEAACQRRDGALGKRLDELASGIVHPSASTVRLGPVATNAKRRRHDGYVACLDFGEEDLPLDELVVRVKRFAGTGHLGAFALAHYAYVRQIPGARDRSFVLSFHTSRNLDLARFVPLAGRDAAGSDITGVARPPDAQRLLSSHEVGSPSSMATYRVVSTNASTVEAYYREHLPGHGWSMLAAHPGERISIGDSKLVAAHRGPETVVVLITPRSPSELFVTLLKAGEP